MKTICTLLLFAITSYNACAQTPNWNELFRQKKTQRNYLIQQIAALKVYLGYLKKGYEIVDKGLTTIGDIKNGTFNLDKDYLNSLKNVSPVIRNSPKIKDVLVYNEFILTSTRKLVEQFEDNQNFTREEGGQFKTIRNNLVKRCGNALDDLYVVTTSGGAEMTDDERLKRLDHIHSDMQVHYEFTKDLMQTVQLLSMQRSKENNTINRSRHLHDI